MLYQPLISILHRISSHQQSHQSRQRDHLGAHPYSSHIYRPGSGGGALHYDYDRRSASESRAVANSVRQSSNAPTQPPGSAAAASSSLTPIDVEEEFRLSEEHPRNMRLRGLRVAARPPPDSLAASPPSIASTAGSRFIDRYNSYRGLSRAAAAAAASSITHARRRAATESALHDEWTELGAPPPPPPPPSSRPPDLDLPPLLDFEPTTGTVPPQPPPVATRGSSASSIRDRARYHRPHSAYRDYNYRTRFVDSLSDSLYEIFRSLKHLNDYFCFRKSIEWRF
jgi:hypothetical protein